MAFGVVLVALLLGLSLPDGAEAGCYHFDSGSVFRATNIATGKCTTLFVLLP
jgi:hypothetical protein